MPAQTTTFVPQAWQNIEATLDISDDWAVAEDETELLECVACRKTFRSEAAWKSHERSKKHVREMERLRDEMLADDQELGLADDAEDSDEHPEQEGPDTNTEARDDDEEASNPRNQPADDRPGDDDIGDPIFTHSSHNPAQDIGLEKLSLADVESREEKGRIEKQKAIPSVTKRDKRRAREVAKKSQQQGAVQVG